MAETPVQIESKITRILIVGTGLIGASTGLALKAAGFKGHISGWDATRVERLTALEMGAVDEVASSREEALSVARHAHVIVLAIPVMGILDWLLELAPVLRSGQLVTDVGSTKLQIAELGQGLFGGGGARFLPGHPMAGKESGGAALAEAGLFRGAMWLFTPFAEEMDELAVEWRSWVAKFGARTLDLDAARHDELCAWVSHLPQMLSTALAALLEDRFGDAPEIAAIGGRALRETTRLGASPYSMWRDVAMSNTDPIAETLFALEQRLAHVRENLKTPALRDEFALANRFRARR
ncbi:prephenate dehydrogenase [Granulicella arctica]|uniref:Prephenate dehydrogenase n=1 Tax=Granulicella arctica TaxID=940613 RepID=A0A7Y9PED9_9BACT|nr:prephenate dehydrogenase/arogenate dehydrogenase family protein [Granulicella arctica]NYF78376.1 prephenate dehydrogenase [Granulicella arctica]